MEYLPLSFLAGILTILAPCVLPVLPIIIGGSLAEHNPWRPAIITLSLAGSIVFFTLILKATTALISIPDQFWKFFSGGIVLIFALSLLFPNLWAKLSHKMGLGSSTHQMLQASTQKKGVLGMVLIGMALGPVFASCSPTYFFILGTVLPMNFSLGLLNLVVYALGLAFVMFLIAYAGQRFMKTLKFAADPKGRVKKVLGILFLIIGLAIITGLDKKFEAHLLEMGWGDFSQIETDLLDKVNKK